MASAYGPFARKHEVRRREQDHRRPVGARVLSERRAGLGNRPLHDDRERGHPAVTIEKFEGFHGGWDGPHFDKIVMWVVGEIATRRQLVENGEGDALDQSLTPEDYEAIKGNPISRS